MNTIYFLLKCWWQCARSVFVTRMNHKSAQSAAGLKKCKQSQPPLLRPFSLPHIIRLYPCLSLLHCHLSYNLKGLQMPSHPPPPPIMSSGCLETPCDKSVASTFEIWIWKRTQGLFKKKQKQKNKEQAMLSGWQLAQLWPVTLSQCSARGYTVGHSGVCILWHDAKCHLLFGS